MKPRIKVPLAALLLAALAAGCAPAPPRCSSKDGQHTWSKWEPIGTSMASDRIVWHQHVCETCGWVERRMGE